MIALRPQAGFVVLLAMALGCSGGNEVELARLRTEAAKAEAEAAKAALERAQLETISAQLETQRDDARRQALGPQAVAFVDKNATEILSQAYPLTLNRLQYRNAELLGIAQNDAGYAATVRLNYVNLLRRPHYLDIAFSYDSRGGFRSWSFAKHSDIVAPGDLTVRSLLQLAK